MSTSHGCGVYSVDLAPLSPVPAFQAGQFLHLTVDPYDPAGFWPESRVFSIASSPRDRSRIRICYSVKGRYTAKMEQLLVPGLDVWIKLPYGDFLIDEASDAVLIAGGTGISAFSAFLETLGGDTRRNVTLIYGARAPNLFLFNDVILSRFETCPRFDVIYFTEESNAEYSRGLAKRLRVPMCFTGRISLSAAIRFPSPGECLEQGTSLAALNRKSSPCYYLSGPPSMLNSLREELLSVGVPDERIRSDAWE